MTVEVRYLGHLGNNLFQYALGRIIAEALGQELVCIPPAEGASWAALSRRSGTRHDLTAHADRFADAPQHIAGAAVAHPQIRYVLGEKFHWSGHGLNLAHLLRHGHGHRVVLQGYFQRVEYYHPHRERIRRWLRVRPVELPCTLRPEDVVVNVRRSLDVLLLDWALAPQYYHEVLAGMSPGRVFVCGLGLDAALREALAPFHPVYLELPAMAALHLLSTANRLVIANSTFSWWGAYLSEASEIHFPRPVRNIWSRDRPEMDLEVPEPRYRYVDDAAVESWRPFRRAAGVRFELEEAQRPVLRIGIPGGRSLTVRHDPGLRGFCAWLAGHEGPLGPVDLHALEVPAALRPQALSLLLDLCRHGALAADPEVVSGLSEWLGAR